MDASSMPADMPNDRIREWADEDSRLAFTYPVRNARLLAVHSYQHQGVLPELPQGSPVAPSHLASIFDGFDPALTGLMSKAISAIMHPVYERSPDSNMMLRMKRPDKQLI